MHVPKLPILNIFKTKSLILITCFILIVSNNLRAQTFRAGLIGGMNLAQIDGDDYAGFNKIGLHVGATAELPFKKQWSFAFELLYSQKGASSSAAQIPSYRNRLNYAEIPILLEYYDKPYVSFGIGLSTARLVYGYESINNVTQYSTPSVLNGTVNTVAGTVNMHSLDYDVVLDAKYYFYKHMVFDLRYSYSIKPFATAAVSQYPNHGWYNNIISLSAIYMFGKRRTFPN